MDWLLVPAALAAIGVAVLLIAGLNGKRKYYKKLDKWRKRGA